MVRWLPNRNLRRSSRDRLEGILAKHILLALGARPLSSIRRSDIQAFVNVLAASGLAPASIRKTYNVLTSIFKTAVADEILGKSPCIEIDLPREDDGDGVQEEMCFLTDEELHRLAGVIGDRYRALVILAGYVGLRWDELAGLKRERVKLRKIEVRETLVELNGHLIPGRPKTKASVRDIVLPGFVAEVLAEHMAKYPDPSGYVFTAPEGGPLRRRNFTRRAFQPALERAGLPPMRLHDLRHTAASIALDTGAQAVQVQRMLGHRSIRTTLDVYGHLLEAREERLAADLDERARAAAERSAADLLPQQPKQVVSMLVGRAANTS